MDAVLRTERDVTSSTPGTDETLTTAAERLAQDLDAMTRLHRLSTRFVRAGDLPQAVLEEIVDVAISITHADMGNIQLFDPASRKLTVAAHRGHEKWWLDFFESVAEGKGASCGAALQQGTRTIVEDVTKSPVFVGTPALEVQLRAGVRAVQSTPLYGSSGDLVGMISTHFRTPHRPDERDLRFLDLLARQAADMIERVRSESALRESEERLRLAQQVARMGSFDWDIRSGVNRWTPELEALYGLPPGSFGQTEAAWELLVHPDDRAEAVRRVEQAFQSGGPTEGEWRVVWPDGSVHWIAGRWQVLKDASGKPLRMTGINFEVTDRKRAEELRASEAALREADRQKNHFLGMLSHELRNPLAPIRNSLYLLEHAEPTGQEAHRAREVINRQVGHLTRLVDDLLDVTRITRGKIELRRVDLDLAALVRRTADDYRRMMEDRGVDLAVEPGGGRIVVDGDETRLAQVFGNLLSNAAKFTPVGGRVTIAAHAEDGHAVVRVRDTGPGIAPDVLPSLFEPFTQAKQTLARTEGGLGLGLALVRGLVSLHGGEVEAVSGSGGAEFIVTLPLASRQDSRAAPPAGPAKAAAPVAHRRVLVVDDNEDAADTLAELVRTLGHDAEVAYDGAAAVRRAGEYHPDVVLCDIGLPVMDGYAVAHELRAAHGRDVRLVAISGYAQPDDVTRAAEAGFDEHVAKPCGPEQIERLLP